MPAPQPIFGQLSLLIVDDDPEIHEDYTRTLGAANSAARLQRLEREFYGNASPDTAEIEFRLTHTFQGEEAVEAVAAELTAGRRFAVAFVDMRMPPGYDGAEAVARMWAVDPDIQVVICTAHSDFTWEDTIKRAGRSDGLHLLRKPFRPEQVRNFASVLGKKWELRLRGKSQY